MVLWQGLTEGGTAVPVQVTEAGRVVAEGQQGPEGPPGEQGPQGPQGEYGPGDDVDLGSITAAGVVDIGDNNSSNTLSYGLFARNNNSGVSGASIIARNWFNTPSQAALFTGFDKNGTATASISADGSASFAENVVVPNSAAADRCAITDLGMNVVRSTADSGKKVWSALGGGNETSVINSDGSASFASNKCGFTDAGEVFFTSRGTRYKLEVAGGLCNAIPYTREMQLRERVEDKRKPRPTDSVPED